MSSNYSLSPRTYEGSRYTTVGVVKGWVDRRHAHFLSNCNPRAVRIASYHIPANEIPSKQTQHDILKANQKSPDCLRDGCQPESVIARRG